MTTAVIRPAWTPMTVTLMIVGFIVFWPLGLAMLAYILWGDRFHETFDRVRDKTRQSGFSGSCRMGGRMDRTGNAAFDAYREAELERLAEERRKLDEERREFETFVEELRRAKDQEEFERFMSARAKRERAATRKVKGAKDDAEDI